MARAPKPANIAEAPELLRLAREVRESGQSRVLREGGEDSAMLVPIPATSGYPWRQKTVDDFEAFRSAVGGWQDVNTYELLSNVYADRNIRDRPDLDWPTVRPEGTRSR